MNEAEVTDRTELIETLVKVLSPEDREKIMNVADSFRQEGEQRGETKTNAQIVRNMLGMGLDLEFIHKATGISITEIKNLMQ